jgi:Flp pilus assembly protein TadD
MKLRYSRKFLVVAVLAAIAGTAIAADQDQLRTQDQIRDQDVYGSQLMTQQERNEHRNKMRAAKTEQERERIRAEHHEQMKVRAKERGVTLPDEPPAGRGPGKGPGPGGGMGPGGGGRY